jgi:hypothetical protein
MRDLYTEVSARIIAELEGGAAPWVKPWSATAGQNVPQNSDVYDDGALARSSRRSTAGRGAGSLAMSSSPARDSYPRLLSLNVRRREARSQRCRSDAAINAHTRPLEPPWNLFGEK